MSGPRASDGQEPGAPAPSLALTSEVRAFWRLCVCRRVARAGAAAPPMYSILLIVRIGLFAGGCWRELVRADAGRALVAPLSSAWRLRLPPALSDGAGLRGVEGLDVVDCFCGLGGWTCALYRAGAARVVGVDNHAARLRLHAANFPGSECVNADFDFPPAVTRRLERCGPFDAACISSPCQGFSCRDSSNPNRRLFWKAPQALLALRAPPAIMFGENVPAAVEPTEQPEVQEAWRLLRNAGYAVQWAVTRADEHGAPTRRRRLFYVAYRLSAGAVCNFEERAEAVAGGHRALLADSWGNGFHYFHPHSKDKWVDGGQKSVYSNAVALRTLRASAGKLPASLLPRRISPLDDAPFTPEQLLSPGDLLHCSGFPTHCFVPCSRREVFQTVANAVVPQMAELALGSVAIPEKPAAARQHEPLVCRCTTDTWEPCGLALRRLGQAMRGITHVIGVHADTYWSLFDFEDFSRLALCRNRGARRALNGHRFAIVATDWTPVQVRRAAQACEALCPATPTSDLAIPGAAAVLITSIEKYQHAVAETHVSGIRMFAANHYFWTCAHGSVSTEHDAWLFTNEGKSQARAAASMSGVRRALRAQLSRALTAGERIDNLRTAVLEAVRAPPHFGLVPDCSTAATVASADPYFDIEKEYADAEPVCVCGICDDIAVEVEPHCLGDERRQSLG